MKGEFYKMDFRAWNIGTVDLSLEQEAAYLRLCHAMYDVGGPVPNSPRFLMGIFRCGNVKAVALVRQLIDADKIQCSAGGKLTNRRVSAELADRARLSAKRSLAGEKGGTARRRDTDCQTGEGGVGIDCTAGESRLATACTAGAHRLVASNSLLPNNSVQAGASPSVSRGEERRGDSPLSPGGSEPDGFAEFRAAYPRRSTAFPMTAASQRWREAVRQGATPAEIINGARAYAAEQARIDKVGTQFVKTADAWLNQGCWRDYRPEVQAASALRAVVTDGEWRQRVQSWKARRGYWPWSSPPPDQPDTLVPDHVLRDCGFGADEGPTDLTLTVAA
ncbi:DUF1376 domain-containing protein [Methylobacterium sp. NPDC080182]|uniref:DUF1376 domain-containing protein n=1 Tax=Methylobacterium sp. NPDC080182 TaxID=3390590 RepID=UPI003CFCF4AC